MNNTKQNKVHLSFIQIQLSHINIAQLFLLYLSFIILFSRNDYKSLVLTEALLRTSGIILNLQYLALSKHSNKILNRYSNVILLVIGLLYKFGSIFILVNILIKRPILIQLKIQDYYVFDQKNFLSRKYIFTMYTNFI